MSKYILTFAVVNGTPQFVRRFDPDQVRLIEEIDVMFSSSKQIETMRLYRLTEDGELKHVQTWTRKTVVII